MYSVNAPCCSAEYLALELIQLSELLNERSNNVGPRWEWKYIAILIWLEAFLFSQLKPVYCYCYYVPTSLNNKANDLSNHGTSWARLFQAGFSFFCSSQKASAIYNI